MTLALALLSGGLVSTGLHAAYVWAFYRLAAIEAGGRERRRWLVVLTGKALLFVVAAAEAALGLFTWFLPTLLAVLVLLVIASLTLRGRYWLFTPTVSEQTELAQRREAIRRFFRRPVAWALTISYLLVVPAILVAVVLVIVVSS